MVKLKISNRVVNYLSLIFGFVMVIILARVIVQYKTSPGDASAAAIDTNKRLIVKFKQNIKNTDKDTFRNKYKLTKKSDLLPGMELLEIDPAEIIKTKITKVKSDKNIEFVQEDELVFPNAISEVVPNDPMFTYQYYLRRMMFPRAWSLQKATNVTVAVCDTGFESTHPDLSGVFVSNLGFNTVDNSTNWTPIADHGTMVAGTISAVANNATGIAGVSWGTKIIPVRVSNATNGSAYTSDLVECIKYAADRGAKAINVSYGMGDPSARISASDYAETKGSIVVNSAGNSGSDPGYPDASSTIFVSATGEYDDKANFTSFGNYVDVAAPGVNIYTTNTGGTYSYVSGTSFSSPITVGTLALIWAKNPTATVAQVKQILFSSVDDIGNPGEDIYFGVGRINACKAIYGVSSVNCQAFSGLSADLRETQAKFNFSYPMTGYFGLTISNTPDLYQGAFLGSSNLNPITISNPISSSLYKCGTLVWWSILSPDHVYSPVQTSFVNCASLIPTLISPADGINNPSRTFTWSAVPNAVNYRIWISKDGSPDLLVNQFVNGTSYTATSLPVNTKLYWRVQTYFSQGYPGEFSPTRSTMIPEFTNLSGTFEQNKATFNFKYPTTSSYVVEMSTTPNFTAGVYNNFGTGSSSPIVVSSPTKWDQYRCGYTLYWRVTSKDGVVSPVQTAFVYCPTIVPTLTTPTNNSYVYTSTPTYDWSDVTGAISYHLQASVDSTFNLLNYSNYNIIGSQITTAMSTSQFGKYYWRVRVGYPNGLASNWSSVNSFTLTFMPTAPTNTSPTNGAIVTNTKPTLTWNGGNSNVVMASFNLQVSTVRDFSTRILDTSVGAVRTYTLTTALTPGTQYYWRIKGKDINNVETPWSMVTSFTVLSSTPPPSPVPTPIPTPIGVSSCTISISPLVNLSNQPVLTIGQMEETTSVNVATTATGGVVTKITFAPQPSNGYINFDVCDSSLSICPTQSTSYTDTSAPFGAKITAKYNKSSGKLLVTATMNTNQTCSTTVMMGGTVPQCFTYVDQFGNKYLDTIPWNLKVGNSYILTPTKANPTDVVDYVLWPGGLYDSSNVYQSDIFLQTYPLPITYKPTIAGTTYMIISGRPNMCKQYTYFTVK